MHAADSRALSAAQDRLRAAEDTIRACRDEAAAATATLLAERQGWAARETTLAHTASEATSVAADLRHQNGLLHSQVRVMDSLWSVKTFPRSNRQHPSIFILRSCHAA